MANDTFGGRMQLQLSDGTRLTMRGDFKIAGAGIKVEAERNLDGSAARLVSLKPYKAEMDLEMPRGFSLDRLLGFQGAVTISEAHTGVMHLLGDGFFTGEPVTDRMTGKTTGVAFEATSYRVV